MVLTVFYRFLSPVFYCFLFKAKHFTPSRRIHRLPPPKGLVIAALQLLCAAVQGNLQEQPAKRSLGVGGRVVWVCKWGMCS